MKSFSILRREIREALSVFGFKRPTEVQEEAIPGILRGENVLLIALFFIIDVGKQFNHTF